MDNEPIYASVQDVDNVGQERQHFVRQNSVRRKKSAANKPPLPSTRQKTSQEKPKDDLQRGNVRDTYAKTYKKNMHPDDATSVSDDINTDSDSRHNAVVTERINRTQTTQLGYPRSEHLKSTRVVDKHNHRQRKFQASDTSDSGIFHSKSELSSHDGRTEERSFQSGDTVDIWDMPEQLQHVIQLYQTKLIQKDELLDAHEAEIEELESNLQKVERENEELRKLLPEINIRLPVTHEEWKLLREQAQLVLEENELLTHQLEHLQEELRDNHVVHSRQATLLRQSLDASQSDKSTLQEELKQTRQRFEFLRDQYNVLRLESVDCISREQHSESLRDCRRLLDELKNKYEDELDAVTKDLKILQTEKSNLLARITKLSSENQQLEIENNVLLVEHKKCLVKLRRLRKQLTKTKMDNTSYRFKMNVLQTQVSKMTEEKNEYSFMVLRAFDEMNSLLLHVENKMLTSENVQSLKVAKTKLMDHLKAELTKMQVRTEKMLTKTLENSLKSHQHLLKRRER